MLRDHRPLAKNSENIEYWPKPLHPRQLWDHIPLKPNPGRDFLLRLPNPSSCICSIWYPQWEPRLLASPCNCITDLIQTCVCLLLCPLSVAARFLGPSCVDCSMLPLEFFNNKSVFFKLVILYKCIAGAVRNEHKHLSTVNLLYQCGRWWKTPWKRREVWASVEQYARLYRSTKFLTVLPMRATLQLQGLDNQIQDRLLSLFCPVRAQLIFVCFNLYTQFNILSLEIYLFFGLWFELHETPQQLSC